MVPRAREAAALRSLVSKMRTSSLGHSSAAASTRRLGSSTRAAATAGNGGAATPPPPHPRPLAAWARRLAAAGAGAALLVAAAPALLSTPWGTRFAGSAAGAAMLAPDTSRAPRRQGGRRRVEIDRLSLAWGSPVVASGVRVYDEDAGPLLTAERVSTAEPLLPVARALVAAAVGGRPLADGSAARGSAAAKTSSPPPATVNISITNPVVDASLRESRDGGGFRVAALFGGGGGPSGAASAHAPPPTTTTAPSPLSVADASAPFSADVVVGDTFSVCVSDGLLRLPEAMAEALVGDSKSGRVHLVAVAGERAVRAAAAPDGERLLARSPEVEAAGVELGVVVGGGGDGQGVQQEQEEQQQRQKHQQQQPSTLFPLAWLSSSPAAAAAAAEGAPPPAPFAVQLHSPRCAAEARGWWVMPPKRGGDDAYYVMERPALAAVELTPELASRTLARANPLLRGAIGLVAEGENFGAGARGGRRGRAASSATPPRLSVAYCPEGGMLPADRARVSVAPARVAVQIAGIAEGVGGAAASTAGAATSPVGIAAALLELCGVRVIGARGEVLEARVARMDVDVDGDVFETRRVRVALGRGGERGGGGEVTVALWGRYDAQSDQVAMRIGLPARAALKAVLPKRVLDRLPTTVMGTAEGEDDDAANASANAADPDPPLLTLDVAGPADAPRADWQGAARQLASLSAGAAISAAFGGGGGEV